MLVEAGLKPLEVIDNGISVTFRVWRPKGNALAEKDVEKPVRKHWPTYRLSLLYLPSKYRQFVCNGDDVDVISEDWDISQSFLLEAVNCNHYKALMLICAISIYDSFPTIWGRTLTDGEYEIYFNRSSMGEGRDISNTYVNWPIIRMRRVKIYFDIP